MCLASGIRYYLQNKAGVSGASPWTCIRRPGYGWGGEGTVQGQDTSAVLMDVDFHVGILDFRPPRIVMTMNNGSVAYYPGRGNDLNPSEEWVQLSDGFGTHITTQSVEFDKEAPYPKVPPPLLQRPHSHGCGGGHLGPSKTRALASPVPIMRRGRSVDHGMCVCVGHRGRGTGAMGVGGRGGGGLLGGHHSP